MWPVVFTLMLSADPAGIDFALAKTYFDEVRQIADNDGGRLWGCRLNGPLIFVDPQTRQAVANRADSAGILKPKNGVFVGSYPKNEAVANTALKWEGVRWTMAMWPLPKEAAERARILIHESFHRVQPELKWPQGTPECPHLDDLEGRVLLQLEYRALAKALLAKGDLRVGHVRAALSFRYQRYGASPQAEESERELELVEGLAEYTGLKLCGKKDDATRRMLAGRLKQRENAESYSRSFAYDTAPAYGLMLDELDPTWRTTLKGNWDLTGIVARKVGPLVKQAELGALAKQYGGDELKVRETRLTQKREAVRDELRERLVTGPVLTLTLRNPQVEFNPSNLIALGDEGTVYPTMKVIDEWGVLTVTSGGALMKDWATVRVPVPTKVGAALVEGEGWSLKLNAGWKTGPGSRAGDLALIQE
jgi:hypothetical protein